MLNQHPEIYCAEELLEKYSKVFKSLKWKLGAWSGSKLFIRYAMSNNSTEVFGFEMKLWHLYRLGVSVNQAIDFIDRIGIDKHIVLERQNYLRVIASSSVSKETSFWHTKSKNIPSLTKIHLNSNGLTYAFQKFSDFYNEIKGSLDRNYLCLSYEEDILQDPKVAFNKVVNFLELDKLEPNIDLGRTNPYPLKEMILNFDEISDRLKNTPYEWMLES